ncbi:uncharacterized protein CANTADRAFT_53378 [Suhomyces tanzawaensis NRRL Y-17324]|uniref:Transcription factor domain-containing protein n=1 Tax=Suhomyces tanzawaensis NRRL Y-17324 TaxID=984487 RepID=A0A1E4SGR5_9ASCO|nr:uncharacterized protein CANTADRAFT_53378 [Suhomyces tanzawaensis NRRL Y-17324]ODV78707.1 hypothetical protein CANTADRAFT_53378 [Suhomyces tanzawaensis NRRL Y-17324]
MSFSKFIPNVSLSVQDSELYHHFIVNFIPTISLPHSHPLLSPVHIWGQMGKQSQILADIFLCCGASYLSCAYKLLPEAADLSSHYEDLAERKYHQALKSLGTAINMKQVDIDSDWLIVAGLTLCLRDRAYGLNGSRCAKHLTFVYNLLQRRYSQKSLTAASYQDPTYNLDGVLEVNSPQKINLYNSLITPTEKLLMDSFVFNYSATLLSCSKLDLMTLPSPYGFFPKIKEWLNCPIYQDCDVAWMNNPVLGSALESFEVSAKLTWLSRLHFEVGNEKVVDKDSELYMDSERFWSMILPLKDELQVIDKKLELYKLELDPLRYSKAHIISYDDLRSNLAVAIIVLNSAKIMLEKYINPKVPSFLPCVQDPVNAAFRELEHAPLGNSSASLSAISLFILGTATKEASRRDFLANILKEFSVALASNVGSNILRILTGAWEKEDFDKNVLNLGDQGYKSFDLLFDRESIEQLAF